MATAPWRRSPDRTSNRHCARGRYAGAEADDKDAQRTGLTCSERAMIVYPGVDYQAEVYHLVPGRARIRRSSWRSGL